MQVEEVFLNLCRHKELTMKIYILFLFCMSRSFSFGFQQLDGKNIYVKNRLDKVCSGNGSKTRLKMKHEVVTVFSFNSSSALSNSLRCHLELYLPSSSYGFSVFIEEMTLSGSTISGCSEDYLQFGRDILFVTTHLSRKYCGDVEVPVPRSKNGVVRFEFPFTPLARRIYNEEKDKEMDIWININTRDMEENLHKTLTLVVTPFKKTCATRDSLYQQCRFSTKCVRRELFCDGRVNCAWPNVEPADEVHCLEVPTSEENSMHATDLTIIFVVMSVIFSMVAVLVLAVIKYSKKVTKKPDNVPADIVFNRQVSEDMLPIGYLPSCPHMAPLPPPPPYTAQDNPKTNPPPSYSLLIPRS